MDIAWSVWGRCPCIPSLCMCCGNLLAGIVWWVRGMEGRELLLCFRTLLFCFWGGAWLVFQLRCDMPWCGESGEALVRVWREAVVFPLLLRAVWLELWVVVMGSAV
jgi:hypothetical protein